jgi:hypothetical protein
MAPLADTIPLRVYILSLAAGITEEYLAGLPGPGYITPDQVRVGAFAVCRIVRVIFHMGAMTIDTLDILPLYVMALLAGMAVGADIQRIGLPAQNSGPTRVGAQQIAIAAAQVCKIGAAVHCCAAGIRVMNAVAGGTENLTV